MDTRLPGNQSLADNVFGLESPILAEARAGTYVTTYFADVFDRPETLERIWSRLITGYAMDAVALKSAEELKTARSLTARGARALLEHVGEIGCDVCPSVGLGKDWRFEAKDVVGQGLVARKACVHLSIFPNDEPNQGDRRPSRIVPPSRRRRGRNS